MEHQIPRDFDHEHPDSAQSERLNTARAFVRFAPTDKLGRVAFHQQHGRIIFADIRKFFVYLMSCNVSKVLIVAFVLGLAMAAPLLKSQILFLNLVTDVFSAFALGLGQGKATVMQEPTRVAREPIVDRKTRVRISVLGLVIACSTLGA